MGTARTTYYGKPKNFSDDTALVEAMHAIQDEFEAMAGAAYGRGSGRF